MKQTLKATAAVIGIVAAVVILDYIIKGVCYLMFMISEVYNVPI